MTRVLFRLLLIVSLALNGAGAPWAMATATGSSGPDHHRTTASHSAALRMASTHAASRQATAASDCHQADRAAKDAVVERAGGQGDASAPEQSCCAGPDCSCGCMLPPLLARVELLVPKLDWKHPPLAGPGTQVALRRAAPPLRPPAA